MTRIRALLHAVAPIRYAGYVAAFLAVVWYGFKWLFVFSFQVFDWLGADSCNLGTPVAENMCALVRDNQPLLHIGFAVIAVGVLALCVRRYMTARNETPTPGIRWPWV